MNDCYFVGNIGQIEKKTYSGGDFYKFSLAISRYVKDKENTTTWLNCVAFGYVAEKLESCQKGDRLSIKAEFKMNEYTDKNGEIKKIPQFDVKSVEHSMRLEKKEEKVYEANPFGDIRPEDLPF